MKAELQSAGLNTCDKYWSKRAAKDTEIVKDSSL